MQYNIDSDEKHQRNWRCTDIFCWTGIEQSVQQLAMGWTVQGFNPGGG